MKRLLIPVAVIALLLAACATATAPPPPSAIDFRPTPRIPNKAYYTKRCWPGCHYDSAQIKAAPHPDVLEFDSELGTDWRWVNEDPARWTLEEERGVLRIVSQSGSISAGLAGAQNILVRDAPSGHFDIVTKVTFDPSFDSQNATVFIELSDDQVVSLSRGNCQEEDAPSCVGDGAYFDGPEAYCTGNGIPASADTVFLMLRKAGSSYVGYYHSGEGDWTEVGRCSNLTAAPTVVGLVATNGPGDPGAPETPADFDSFALVQRD